MRAFHRFDPNIRTLIAAGLAVVVTVLALALAALYGPQSAPRAHLRLSVATVPTIAQTTTSEGPRRAVASRASRSRPVVRIALPATGVTGDLLDRLAMCESGMNPRTNTGNGFYGAFQWMLSTWHGMGMSGNPIDYTYEQQKAVAARIPVSAWHRQFPRCSRRIGV